VTATTAAPASGPILANPPRDASLGATDRSAFAAVLDSLPFAEAKAGSSVAGDGSKEPRQPEAPLAQPDLNSMLFDGVFLSPPPLALLSTSVADESAAAAAYTSLGALGSANRSEPQNGGPLSPAGAEPATARAAGRLVAERAFQLSLSTSDVMRTVMPPAYEPAPLEPAPGSGEGGRGPMRLSGAPTAAPIREGAPPVFGAVGESASSGASPVGISLLVATSPRSGGGISPYAPIASQISGSSGNPSAVMPRPTAPRGGRNSEAPAPPPAARATGPATAQATAAPSGETADTGLPDASSSGGSPAAPAGSFGALLSAFPAAGPLFGAQDSPASAADVAPQAGMGPAVQRPAAQPVKEIEVDLSPGGLEDVSMTMRLAGDKLSVVIRSPSSETRGSIEGARDAIVDRLAAIGQPLDSLVIQQTGVNADGNANGNGASTDEGSTEGGGQSRQSAGEQRESNDPHAPGRGASGDLRF
jgi:hypothetical protein